MCGFSGELRFDGRRADTRAVERMTATMESRGPDATGMWSQGPAAFGHQRLAIIDLSAAGGQPMHDAQLGLTTVFNGCIYNYRQLREELAGRHGMQFFSDSDTEVLAKAYHVWGENFVTRLQGMFAFAIYERDTGRTLLGRDRFGIKPLYVSQTSGRLRFASTLPALLAGHEVDTSIDTTALHHYLTFHAVVPAPRTILSGVQKLPPATIRRVEADGRMTDTVYWQPQFTRDAEREQFSAHDWEDAVLDALRSSVKWRTVADVPVGVLLSGGVDSSLVVALLAEAGHTNLSTFSIGFDDVGTRAGNEFAFSDLVAKQFGTDHHRLRIPTQEIVPALSDALHAMSEPMVSHDAVAFYLLSREVSQHVKVVQSGQGADEVFAGYHWYPPMAALDAAHNAGRDRLVAQATDTYAQAFFDRDHATRHAFLTPDYHLDDDVAMAFVDAHFRNPGADSATDMALRLDSQVMLVDDPVKRVDNMTMAFGLEARVPFLDHEVLDVAARIPPELKLAHGGKGVLKQVARRVLPAAVIDRPKGYFPVPALTELDDSVVVMVKDALNDPAAHARNLFEQDVVDRLLAAPNETLTPLGGNILWQLGALELWLQSHGVDA